MEKIQNIFRKITNISLDLFFPKRCVGCGAPGSFVCGQCVKKIEQNKTPVCQVCGKINKYGGFCPGCKTPNLTGLIVAARYDSGPLREMIHCLKYSGFTEIAPLLGELIAQRIADKLPRGQKVVVPVPLHKRKEASRGFNQAELIARHISKRLLLPGGNSLERTRNTETQVNLSRKERTDNLAGAFVCSDQEFINGKVVLLIDDVSTTGATLRECARVLRESGARQVWGVVVAKRN